MADVISMRTRRKLGVQDTKVNDKMAETKGKYIGCLPKQEAYMIRRQQSGLLSRQGLINELIDEFDADYKQYLRDIATALMYFNYPPDSFDPEKEKLFIGEDGHMWVVTKEGEEECIE